MGHMGGPINPRPGRGQYRAGFSNTGGSPKPRKKAPCKKPKKKQSQQPVNMTLLIKSSRFDGEDAE